MNQIMFYQISRGLIDLLELKGDSKKEQSYVLGIKGIVILQWDLYFISMYS